MKAFSRALISALLPGIIAKFGGRVLARGGKF